jgi:hypothetical protein
MNHLDNKQSLNNRKRKNHITPYKERGVVAVIVALSIAVLVGFVGLALDLGKLFVTKSELQSSADACALAAAVELTGIDANQLTTAEAAGIATGTRNDVMFQSDPVSIAGSDVTFSEFLDGTYVTKEGAEALKMKFARCTVARTDIPNWFMQVLGIGDQDVNATAVATLAPSQEFSCAIPLGICNDKIEASVPGQWLKGVTDGQGSVTGDFGWIKFGDTNSAAELDDILEGSCGLVDIPEVGADIGKGGSVNALSKAWNTRFGIYQTNPDKPQFPGDDGSPDKTGYAYYPGAVDNPPLSPLVSIPPDLNVVHNRYEDYIKQVAANTPYQGNSNLLETIPLLSPNGGNNPLTDLAAFGINNRRISIVAVLEGDSPGCLDTPTLKDWACILMLHPVDIGGGERPMYIEYLGLASEASSPCATLGIPGGADSTGPKVPTLVQ